MGLNKSIGNMYPWVTHTWNPIRGRCPHECVYCYNRRFWPEKGFRFIKKEIETRLGEGKTIFIGSSFDIFAKEVLDECPNPVVEILRKCRNNPDNSYFFQTKNPRGMYDFCNVFPEDVLLGTTLESSGYYPLASKAPSIEERVEWMEELFGIGFKTMISIEPIMDFEFTGKFIRKIKRINPKFISIGADSKGHQLPEPPATKIRELIDALQEFTEVKIKGNLERIIGPSKPRVNKIERDGIV